MFINNVQAMPLQPARVSEMHFLAIWKPEFHKFFIRCPPWGYLMETVNQQTVKKLNLWGKTVVDKSAWMKTWSGCFYSKNYSENLIKLSITASMFDTAQKMKFSIKNFISKCDQIRRKWRSWSHLLKKSSMENFIFCVV